MENEDEKNKFIWGAWILSTTDTGDETDPKPIEEVYAPTTETEEERNERMMKAVREFASS